MKKKTVVVSLGGSQIIPDDVGYSYLKQFKEVILKHKYDINFVIVCGGGSLARKYIGAVKKSGGGKYLQSLAGISATRANARFLYYFFGMDAPHGVPHTMATVKKYLKKEGIVFCGALEYEPNQTSDSVAADLAKKFKGEFVNLTNVKGLYDKDPNKYKNAKFIKKISWQDFDEIVQGMKFKPGQHFVLDQSASKVIKKKKIVTYIIKNIRDFENYLLEKDFIGTRIGGKDGH